MSSSTETQLGVSCVSEFGSCSAETFSKGGKGGSLSSELMRRMVSAYEDLTHRAIMECGVMYGFDGSDAIRRLGLESVKLSSASSRKKVEKKEIVAKSAFPLPYNGESSDLCCQALRQNNGLYTQCQSHKKGENSYCKSCQQLADKSEDGIPEYGTIAQRQSVGVFEYVDPKGRKPVAYTKVMKKYKVSEEQVLAEAGKFGINIIPAHFEVPSEDTKRGRPKKEKVEKEPKGAKGRPKKEKKVVELSGDGGDLFDALVASASSPKTAIVMEDSDSDNESIVLKPTKKSGLSEEAKSAKAAKAAKKQQEDEAKAAKKQQEEEAKAAKALKKQQDDEARILKKQQEEEAKAAKALKKQQEDEAKAAKKQQEEEAKAAKAAKKTTYEPAKKESDKKGSEKKESEEPGKDRVKHFEFNGKKYLKSKLSGVIYDIEIFESTGEIVHIGQWNEKEQRIDFVKQEESEEEYEEESSDSEEEEEA